MADIPHSKHSGRYTAADTQQQIQQWIYNTADTVADTPWQIYSQIYSTRSGYIFTAADIQKLFKIHSTIYTAADTQRQIHSSGYTVVDEQQQIQ